MDEGILNIIENIKNIDKEISKTETSATDIKEMKRVRQDLISNILLLAKDNILIEENIEIPNANLIKSIDEASSNLVLAHRVLMGKNFKDGFNPNDEHQSQLYDERIKPVVEQEKKYTIMRELIKVLNMSDEEFIYTFKEKYSVDINEKSLTISQRLSCIQRTPLFKAVPAFYDVTTLCDKMTGIGLDEQQKEDFSNIVTDYHLKDSLLTDIKAVEKVKFNNSLSELAPIFLGDKFKIDYYSLENKTSYYENFIPSVLYDALKQYASLYNEQEIAQKVDAAITKVKNNDVLANLLSDYQKQEKDPSHDSLIEKNNAEITKLSKSKNPFGRKAREETIGDLKSELVVAIDIKQKFDHRHEELFNKYFHAIKTELIANGVSAATFGEVRNWDELYRQCFDDANTSYMHMKIDNKPVKLEDVLDSVFSRFKLYIETANFRMEQFKISNKVDKEININSVLNYINMYAKYSINRDGITMPYLSKDISEYYIVDSMIRLDNEYQSLEKENVKTPKI